ncbi:MAG TPA: hypothetical protein VMC85_14095 [Desulfomonilaceae bacterium]|nr:hypothetical protein [Desulfomonilaceae bacterium]
MNNNRPGSIQWFPSRRFDTDFPLVLWFVGLWFYLKSFLYLCYLYMLGLDPPPLPVAAKVEVVYFAVALLPSLFLGLAMWNEMRRWIVPAIAFLAIDTPLLIFHVFRLGDAGYLDSGLTLTGALEFGSLALNVVAFAWLITSYSQLMIERERKPVR